MGRTVPVLNFEQTATINDTQQISNVIDLGGNTLCGIFIPSGFEGGVISFEHATAQAGSFVVIKGADGVDVTATVMADSYVAIDPAQFVGVRFIKIVSDVAVGASRDLMLAIRSL